MASTTAHLASRTIEANSTTHKQRILYARTNRRRYYICSRNKHTAEDLSILWNACSILTFPSLPFPFSSAHAQDWQYYDDKDKKKDRKKNMKKIPDYYSPQLPYYPNGASNPDYYKPRSGTYVNCPDGGALQVKRIGYPVCLGTNEILCKNDWKFGIIRTGYGNQTKSHLELRRDDTDNNRIPDLVYRKFPTANTLCIAEYPQNLAILSVGVAGGTWYLACPNAGNPNKLPRLKIVEEADGGSDRHQLVVRFRDGAGTDDSLWEIFADGRTETANECAWFFIEAAPFTPAPTGVPSSIPSSTPTLSARPSSEPTASPTRLPSARYGSSFFASLINMRETI